MTSYNEVSQTPVEEKKSFAQSIAAIPGDAASFAKQSVLRTKDEVWYYYITILLLTTSYTLITLLLSILPFIYNKPNLLYKLFTIQKENTNSIK